MTQSSELVVRLKQPSWGGPSLAPRSRRALRVAFAALLGVLVLIVAFAVTLVVVIVMSADPGAHLSKVFGLLPLAILGFLIAHAAQFQYRRLRFLPGDPVPILPDRAFTITGDWIEFPGSFWSAPEHWPLDQTTVHVHQNARAGRVTFGSSALAQLATSATRLELTCPGQKTKTFVSGALLESPQDVVERVEAYRRGDGVFPDPVQPRDARFDDQGRYRVWYSHALIYDDTTALSSLMRLFLWCAFAGALTLALGMMLVAFLALAQFEADGGASLALALGFAAFGFVMAAAFRTQLNRYHPNSRVRQQPRSARWAFMVDDEAVTIAQLERRDSQRVPLQDISVQTQPGRWQLLHGRTSRERLILERDGAAFATWPAWQLNEPLPQILEELQRRGVRVERRR